MTEAEKLFNETHARWMSAWSVMHDSRRQVQILDAIIHRNALGKPLSLFPVSDNSVDYISRTGYFLMGLVNFKYKLRIDPHYIGKFWQQA